LLVAAALAGCGGGTTVDKVETNVLASLGKEPPPDVQGTILDVDCPGYANTAKLESGTRLRCGAFNVDKPTHEPDEQIGALQVTVGEEGDYVFRPCTTTATGRGPKC
jgi:hypothetical protein